MDPDVSAAAGSRTGGAPPAVALHGITKRFPGVVANADVDLVARRGEVHALVGENGAGKSTLMKTLYGMHRPDEGTIEVDGQAVSFRSPSDAIAAGIGMVHQHFMLADNLTVLENIVLGSEPRRGGRLDLREARRRVTEVSDRHGLGLVPDQRVGELGVGDRQRVEIAKVLYRGAQVLVLDEPTAVLVPQEVEQLAATLRGLAATGATVLFISHKLDEVLALADTVTVLRAGTTVTTVPAAQVDRAELARLMVGGDLPSPATGGSTVTEHVELAVRGLTVRSPDGRALVDDVDLQVHRGEVVGIAGVEGNGQSELVEALLGLRPVAAGSVHLGAEDITSWATRRRREAGVSYVPEDRHRAGLLLPSPLWENAALGHQTRAPYARGRWVSRRGARRRTAELVARYGVRTPGVDVPAFALSGGNQQKLIMGREMADGPRVLVAAHPTRGVDVGAQAVLWDALRAARAQGLAVLLVSADLDELIGLSDVLLVMYDGRVVAQLDPAHVTPELLGSAMTGGAVDGSGRQAAAGRRAGSAAVVAGAP